MCRKEELPLQSETAPKGIACPFCGGPVFPAPGGFLEMGEYDGRGYSVEGSVDGYQCQNGHGFYAWPDGKNVARENLRLPTPQGFEPKEQTASPTLFVAVVARGGLIEDVSVHLGEREAINALNRVVVGDFEPEEDDARVFRVRSSGVSKDVYSYRPE